MNVGIKQTLSSTDGKLARKTVLVAKKDFATGDKIYKEQPVVTALDLDLQSRGTHCTHCLRPIQSGMSLCLPDDPLEAAYCSKPCQLASTSQSQNLLFGLTNVFPSHRSDTPPAPPSESQTASRRKAQVDLIEHIKATNKIAPLLVSRFVARMIAEEHRKLGLPKSSGSSTPSLPSDLPEPNQGSHEYTFYDHIERLRYSEVLPSSFQEKETGLVKDLLEKAVEGLQEFLSDEQYMTFKGKMGYNAFGVCFSGGRDDRPLATDRPEDMERTRTPYGTSRQTGTAFFRVSSYLTHSCQPCARPSFPGTAELQLIATRPIKAGDEITISYVDVTQHSTETQLESRRRRRMELARGWGFACTCERCEGEVEELGIVKNDADTTKFTAPKVEEAVEKFGRQNAQRVESIE